MQTLYMHMQARLGELEQQRRMCLEATTDATTAIITAASTAAATPGNSRVRELEGQVAHCALRCAVHPEQMGAPMRPGWALLLPGPPPRGAQETQLGSQGARTRMQWLLRKFSCAWHGS